MLSGREFKDPELGVVAHSFNLSTQEQRLACGALRPYFQNKTKPNKVSNIQVKPQLCLTLGSSSSVSSCVKQGQKSQPLPHGTVERSKSYKVCKLCIRA